MFQPLSRSEERLIRGLHRRKERAATGLFLAEGVRVVEDLLASDLELRLAVVSPTLEMSERGRALLQTLQQRTALRRTDDRTLAALVGTQTPQGLVAIVRVPRYELDELEIPAVAPLLILDGIQDPGNFGTLTRTADALGAAAVVTLPGTVDPWNAKSIRAAAGAAFRVPIVEAELEPLVDWLRRRDYTLYGADAAGDAADLLPLAERAALFLGNEGAGLNAATRDAMDRLLAVPIERHAESLNVAVAAGILLFLLSRRG
jgi:TrmH family RNA methyltransferase